jgi:hypothetical protein
LIIYFPKCTKLDIQGELAHRLAKKFYAKTNKRGFERQIARQERRQRLLRAMKRRMDASKAVSEPGSNEPPVEQPPIVQTPVQPPPAAVQEPTSAPSVFDPKDDTLPPIPPRQHHHISESKRTHLHIFELAQKFPNDPAIKVFF